GPPLIGKLLAADRARLAAEQLGVIQADGGGQHGGHIVPVPAVDRPAQRVERGLDGGDQPFGRSGHQLRPFGRWVRKCRAAASTARPTWTGWSEKSIWLPSPQTSSARGRGV